MRSVLWGWKTKELIHSHTKSIVLTFCQICQVLNSTALDKWKIRQGLGGRLIKTPTALS